MALYRHALPQLDGSLYLTDGGIETTLIFHDGLALPDFAAFDLLRSEDGRESLRRYFLTYASLAQRFGAGLVLESPTWRASADWAKRLGYTRQELAFANQAAIELLEGIRESMPAGHRPMVISGCLGPRGDGYRAARVMSEQEAELYHDEQIETLVGTAVDMVTGMTLNYVEEAIGITRAARRCGLPVAISFTLETDGRLPSGQPLSEAIAQVDAVSEAAPVYYMINCAHPTHFEQVLAGAGPWHRLRGLRANASPKSHAELDESVQLDSGNPAELGRQYAALRMLVPGLNVLGGCCGTDHRHVEQIAQACAPFFRFAG